MALFNLAVSYTKGEGVEKDEVEGGRLFNLAGSLGFALAYTGIIIVFEDYDRDREPQSILKNYDEYTL